ncbi:hypothetical protein, partial [Thermus oshimai]
MKHENPHHKHSHPHSEPQHAHPSGGHAAHTGHDKHAGHTPEMFRDRFFVSLLPQYTSKRGTTPLGWTCAHV